MAGSSDMFPDATIAFMLRHTHCKDCDSNNLLDAGTEEEVCVNMLCPSNVERLQD